MKVGFLTRYSKERVAFAADAGFGSLELRIDPSTIGEEEVSEIREEMEQSGLEVSAIFCDGNHLEPDMERRKEIRATFHKAIDLCPKFGTDVLCTNGGYDRGKTVEENISIFKEVFSEYARRAEDRGVKIAMENCPHVSRYPITLGNIACTPEVWAQLFEVVPSKAIGLEHDPSHLVWLGIDYLKSVRDFGDRIYHVHTKDTEVFRDRLGVVGIYGQGWWRFRVPGWGEINWGPYISALHDVGYEGTLSIEHEDPVFGGARTDEGLRLGLKHLQQFIV